ncbi:hypothetical protein NC652_005734 [Populus alba x Populus x berolinensis]|nr:hypothetical protein NC652_005734 [Populus alba x Populus x berolinensis]
MVNYYHGCDYLLLHAQNLRTDIRLSTSLVELALAQHHLWENPSAKGLFCLSKK